MKNNTHIFLFLVVLFPPSVFAITGLTDPTRPAGYISEPQVVQIYDLPKELIDWNVTAIRIKNEDRSAIVNGRLVRAGDPVGPAKVIEITPVSVVLDYEGKQVVVRLYSNAINKNPRTNSTTGNE